MYLKSPEIFLVVGQLLLSQPFDFRTLRHQRLCVRVVSVSGCVRARVSWLFEVTQTQTQTQTQLQTRKLRHLLLAQT